MQITEFRTEYGTTGNGGEAHICIAPKSALRRSAFYSNANEACEDQTRWQNKLGFTPLALCIIEPGHIHFFQLDITV